MRASQFHIATTKETPSDAEVASHQLMLRAGFIKRLSSGLYSIMPIGLRVVRKIETIVREEMNRAGAVELLMPAVQPAEIWQESGRWEKYGPELLRFLDRHEREYCMGPTHEEVITDIARKDIRSYKQLPANFYQIQTKFRDEIRPRFGVMRSREFIMKDAYSFHINAESLAETFDDMHNAYCAIFDRIGLDYRASVVQNHVSFMCSHPAAKTHWPIQPKITSLLMLKKPQRYQLENGVALPKPWKLSTHLAYTQSTTWPLNWASVPSVALKHCW